MNKQKIEKLSLLLITIIFLTSCGSLSSLPKTTPAPPLPPAKTIPTQNKEIVSAIRFLEDRVKDNPSDFVAYNLLAERYLRLLNETNNFTYLDLASRAISSSLEIAPKEKNLAALTALAEIEYTSHDFSAASEDAKLLTKLMPKSLAAHQILADSLLELGDYEQAKSIYQQMEKKTDYSSQATVSIEIRLARVASLYGQTKIAENHLLAALNAAIEDARPSRERVAWCRWQLGDLAFSIGKYDIAKQHYQDALITYPDYPRALASLGRVLAAQGELDKAIEALQKAFNILPEPIFAAMLGDIYKVMGKEKEAFQQYELVEQIGRLNKLNGALYNRQLNLFYADHDIKLEEAYANAVKEYEIRQDVYGADALAWAAFKVGKLDEAQKMIKEALKLNTQDAKFLYHAAMIAKANGDKKVAQDYLKRVLELNPKFDLLQSEIAKKTLNELAL